MGFLRNAILATAAVAALVGTLLVLVPKDASAVQVTLSPGGIGGLTTSGFDLTANVNIPAGEHIPLGYAKVLVTAASGSFSGGLLQSPFVCSPDTTSGVTITGISGGNPSFGRFNGYGYEPQAYGYGYTFTSTSLDFSGYNAGYALGYGYGYGYGTHDTNIRITVHVTGCTFTGFAANGLAEFRIQLLVGSDNNSLRLLKSTPARVAFFNPSLTPTTAPTATAGVNVDQTDLGNGGGFRFTLFDTDLTGGLNNFLTGTGINLPFTGGLSGTAASATLDITDPAGLPPGTSLNMEFIDQGSLPVSGAPFGIDVTGLTSNAAASTAAGFVHITLNGPNGPINPNGKIALTVKLNVPVAYFTATSTAVSQFRLLEFNEATGLYQATLAPTATNTAGDPVVFTFRITSFSSFAMISGFLGGSGGGAPTVTTGPTTVPSTATGTNTGTNTGTGTGTGTGTTNPSTTAPAPTGTQAITATTGATSTATKSKGGIPGFEAVALVGAMAAALLLVRRRIA